MEAYYTRSSVIQALERVASALREESDSLTRLDQVLGDGDLGVTAKKIARSVETATANPQPGGIGELVVAAGMAIVQEAPSTFGTLVGFAAIRAGRVISGKNRVSASDIVAMIEAADQAIQEKGKAKLGDKTIVDALHPATEALKSAVETGVDITDASRSMLQAAIDGAAAVTACSTKVGRGSWQGLRSEGNPDPGCAALIVILRALIGNESSVEV